MKLQTPFYIEKREGKGNHISLNGTWEFCYTDEPTDEPDNLSFEYKTELPSATYFDIYNAGILPHPYEKENSHLYRFADQTVWYYRRRFSMDGVEKQGKAFLCFDGIGYYSKLWINGSQIGEHEGLFGGPIADISPWLYYGGDNEILVEVTSCNYGIPDEEWKNIYRSRDKKFLVPWNMVKDSHTSNGDFTVMGIYRDVRIEILPAVHLNRPYMTTETIAEDAAGLHLSVEIAAGDFDELRVPMNDPVGNGYVYGYVNGINAEPGDVKVEIGLQIAEKETKSIVYTSVDEKILYDYKKVGINEKYYECQFFEKDFEIKNPKLWYPNGLGSPELYTVELTLSREGRQIDRLAFDFGIRRFSMSRTAGERMRTRWGEFKAEINGRSFFIKGMNWMPLDMLQNIKEEDYIWAVDLAKKENIQMLRVWGAGNAPESDLFYKLCDENGILVWQDSFISNHSNPYWDKELFQAQQCMYLYRIRNHPSLVIHCSGNENNPYDLGNNCVWVWQRETEDLDPSRIRIRTTPDKGSAHVYRGFEPSWYRKMYKQLPFLGEAGTHTFPNAKALRQLLSEDDFNSPIGRFGDEKMMEEHKGFVNHITENDTWGMMKKIPALSHMASVEHTTISELCETSGIASYEYYQFMVQAMREQYPITGGVMPWTFKRPWTTVGVQMLDGFGDPVAPYYAVKNAYKELEVHIAFTEITYAAGDTVEIATRIINESGKDRQVTVKTEIYDPHLQCADSFKESLVVRADEYQVRLRPKTFVIPDHYRESYFFVRASLYEEERLVSQSFYWLAVLACLEDEAYKRERRANSTDVILFEKGPFLKDQLENIKKQAAVSAAAENVRREGRRIYGMLTVSNASETPAFPVHIVFDNDGIVQCLDDDWFFLEGNETRRIAFSLRNDKQTEEPLIVKVWAWNSAEQVSVIA